MTISSVRFSIIDSAAQLIVKEFTTLSGNDPLNAIIETSKTALKDIGDFLSANIDLPSFELPDNPLSDLGEKLGFSFDDIKPSFFSETFNSSTYSQCMAPMNSALDPLNQSNGLISKLVGGYPSSQAMMKQGSSSLSLSSLLSHVNTFTGTGVQYTNSQSVGMLGNLLKVVNASNKYGLYGTNNYMGNTIQNPTIAGQLNAVSLMNAVNKKNPLALLDGLSSPSAGYAKTSYPNVVSDIVRELTLPKRLNENSYDRYARIIETGLSRVNSNYRTQTYGQTSADYQRLYNNRSYNTQNRTCTMTDQEAFNVSQQAMRQDLKDTAYI